MEKELYLPKVDIRETIDLCCAIKDTLLKRSILERAMDIIRTYDIGACSASEFIDAQNQIYDIYEAAMINQMNEDSRQIQTKFEVCRTLKGQPVYIGDAIRWQIVGGIYENTGTVFYDTKECAFKIRSKSGMQCIFLPLIEYAIFEHANPADMDVV